MKIIKSPLYFLALIFAISVHAQNKVGIGISTPEMKLHVSESDSAVLLLQNNQALQNNVSNGLYFKTGIGANPYTGALKTIGLSDASARLGFYTFTSSDIGGLKERMSISDGGFIGMGTINPQRNLHIRDSRTELMMLDNSSDLANGSETSLIFRNGTGTRSYTGAVKTIGTSSSEARLGLFTSAAVTSSGLQERVSIMDDGDVGIGVTSPDAKLHITEQTGNLMRLQNSMALGQDIESGITFMTGSGGSAFNTGAIKTIGKDDNEARLGFFTFASTNSANLKERMSIKDGGEVGIGTVHPEANLHIADSEEKVLILENSSTLGTDVSTSMYFKTGTSGNAYTGAIKTIGQGPVASRLGFFTFASSDPNGLRERLSISDNGNIGVGTTDPIATFHIDGGLVVEDGTQGEGKILTSNGVGLASWQVQKPATCNLSIGDTHAGGIIFYLDGSGCHGLVAKNGDEPGFYQWSVGLTVTDAIGQGLYEGEHATNKIVSKLSTTNAPAAGQCSNLTHNGFSDWYLPSRIELDMMFVNLKSAGLGNFSDAFYWSSTESTYAAAWNQNFTDGFMAAPPPPIGNKSNAHKVRAIRAF